MKRSAAYAALLAVAAWALFARSAAFEFVRLDDQDYTFLCPFVFNGFSWSNLAVAFSSPSYAAIWMPFTFLSYMLDISWFGPAMWPHHLFNTLIHAANAVLVFALLRRLVPGSPAAAFAAALLWAVHPLRVEPVCWIAGRKELLWSFFALAGILFWTARRRAVDWRTVAGWACCALASMSKPTAMCVPLLYLGASLYAKDRGIAAPSGASPKLRAIAYMPPFMMAFATGALACWSQTHAAGHAARSLFSAPLWRRLLNAAVSAGLELYRSLVPAALHPDRPFRAAGMPEDALFGLCALAAALALVAFFAIRRRGSASRAVALLAASFFVFSAAPTLGVFGSFGREAWADRFAYFPAIGIAVALAAALDAARFRRTALAAALALALPFAALSFRLSDIWTNDWTLFSRVLECEGDHARALRHVASEECARFKDLDAGIAHFRRSLELEERFETRSELAYALARRATPADVKEVRRLGIAVVCDRSLDRRGQMLEALGMAAMEEGRFEEAASFFESAIAAPNRFYSADAAKRLLQECRKRAPDGSCAPAADMR